MLTIMELLISHFFNFIMLLIYIIISAIIYITAQGEEGYIYGKDMRIRLKKNM